MELEFMSPSQFRTWLKRNAEAGSGVWLRFHKGKGAAGLSAEDALDQALCFGWIDGRMRREGEASYLKYFAPRRKGSEWSEKNKKAVTRLRGAGLLTERGERAVAEAKANGEWDKASPALDFEAMIADLGARLKFDAEAAEKFHGCSASLKKRYAGFYHEAKTDATRQKRLEKIRTALLNGDKGMLS